MKSKIIYLLVFAIISFKADCQLSFFQELIRDRQEVIFDTSGRIISFPSTFVTKNTQLRFTVKTPGRIHQPWMLLLKKHLTNTLKYINEDEVNRAYICLFEKSRSFEKFTEDAKMILSLRDTCSLEEMSNYIKEKKIDSIIPISNLLENIKSQYLVKIYRDNVCVDSVLLKEPKDCKTGCTEFSSDFEKIKNRNCESCITTTGNQLRFELVYFNPWEKTIRDWYAMKAREFFTETKGQLPTVISSLESVGNEGITDQVFRKSVRTISLLNNWFVNWFWFNDGVLSLDPFNVLTRTGMKNLTREISEKDIEINNLREKLIFYDSIKKALPKKLDQIKLVEKAQEEQLVLTKSIETATALKTSLQQQMKGNPFFAKISSSTIAYEGRMQLSKSFLALNMRSVNPQKQFDASNNFRPVLLKYFQRRKINEIPENENLYIAVHNIPQNIKLKIEEKALQFNDQEEFTKLVSDQLSKIDFSNLDASTVKNLEDFVSSLGVAGSVESKLKGASITDEDCASGLKPLLKNFSAKIKSGFITFPPDTSLFVEVASIGPLYRTQLDPITSFETPYRDSITIKAVYTKDSSAPVAKTFVKVGRLSFIQLAAGMAVNKEPVSITKIDTSGNGFRVSSSDNRAKAIFGVKIYPFRNYNRDHGLIPRYPLRRLSVMGAFELLHPLDNFYIGGAYDIVPGLAFSAGVNYYLQTRYQIENNVVTNTSRSYEKSGAYYSVVVNPVLFVQFVKLFFKKL